jgi:hypothetical protein
MTIFYPQAEIALVAVVKTNHYVRGGNTNEKAKTD